MKNFKGMALAALMIVISGMAASAFAQVGAKDAKDAKGAEPAAEAAAKSSAESATESAKAAKKKKSTDVSFEDVLVQGKYHFSDEAVTTVENDNILDALLGVRTDFKDRVKKSTARH